MLKIRTATMLTLTAITAATMLTGCTPVSITPEPAPTIETVKNKTVEPVIIDLNKADGQTYDIPLTNVAVINIGDTDATSWTQEIAYPEIAMFQQDAEEDTVLYNPTLMPMSVGETAVTLQNIQTGQIIVFTVHIVD